MYFIFGASPPSFLAAALDDAAEEHEAHAAGPTVLRERLVAARPLGGAGVVVALGGSLFTVVGLTLLSKILTEF